jgi:hypothetical protein
MALVMAAEAPIEGGEVAVEEVVAVAEVDVVGDVVDEVGATAIRTLPGATPPHSGTPCLKRTSRRYETHVRRRSVKWLRSKGTATMGMGLPEGPERMKKMALVQL